jgi:hypothetical protein
VAVEALDRLALARDGQIRAACLNLARSARLAIAREAERSGTHRWWPQIPRGKPCPGATSLAVLALMSVPAHRELAHAGAQHLLAHPDKWVASVHPDDQLSVHWRILSFSLGLQAVLLPGGAQQPTRLVLQESIGHFDALWNGDHRAWATHPGAEGSTTGSFGVVTAVAALKRAWQFDPAEHIGRSTRRKSRRYATHVPRASRQVIVDEATNTVSVLGADDDLLAQLEIRGPKQWPLFVAIARRRYEAAQRGHDDQVAQTVSAAELAAIGGIQETSIVRAVHRLNVAFSKAARRAGTRGFKDLIEPITPGGSNERRFGMEEVIVRFADR